MAETKMIDKSIVAGEALDDLEAGHVAKEGSTGAFEDRLVEAYMTVIEIAQLHPQSNIDVSNLEHSGGLSTDEAQERLGIHGKNMLSPPPKTPEWLRFLEQFKSIFLILLILSGLLSLVAYIVLGDITNLYLAVVLLVVVFLTGLVQWHEEGKARKVADSFQSLLASTCTVFRDEQQLTVDVKTLVPGDLVLVTNGEKVPADMVLLMCRGLKVECSSLTGESEPISCSDEKSPPDTLRFECKNVVFNGSLCFDGMAIGMVLRTGDKTAIGNVAKLASETKMRESTLQIEVRNFVKLVAIIAVTMATLSFIISIFVQGARSVEDIFTLFINGFLTIMVANVPQGLPSTVVSLLSLAARRMAQRAVLVKRIDCVETLGSCSVICSDKTGTLTKNQMTVTDVWLDQQLVRRYRKQPVSLHTQDPQAMLFRTGILCNRAKAMDQHALSHREETWREHQMQNLSSVSALSWGGNALHSARSQREKLLEQAEFVGNPSDVAILSYCDLYVSSSKLRKEYPIVFEVPFNSTNKWQLVAVKTKSPEINGEVEFELLMKGAPEVILGRCTTFASRKGDHQECEIDDEFRTEFKTMYERFASEGRRVIALCSKKFHAPADFVFDDEDNQYNFPTTGLTFIGLIAIMDPPRDNVPDAIAKCLSAGVRVFMVTGDHPLTARSIAKQIGLLKSENNIELLENHTSETDWDTCDGAVIHGSRIEALTDDQWKCILSKEGGICFARTTPSHKLLIVEKCQSLMGMIVAVTGDGVNDAPALKQADIGVAMGMNGSAVAQDAADILLMDDNFASIVAGIEEGRIIFDNIKKTIAYTMAHIFPQVVSALIALLAGLPAGLTPMQVLTMDLGTELGPAISLAYEKAESHIMDRKPRDPTKDRLVSPRLLFYSYVTAGLISSIGCLLSYRFTYKSNGLLLSDFYKPNLDGSGGSFFTLTASEPVTVERTGRVYSAEEQRDIFSQGTTAFYITLAVAQFFHIWACKTRIVSLFVHGFENKLTFDGVAFGIFLVIFFSYVPGVQDIVGSTVVGWIPWVCAVITGLVHLIYNETVKMYFRRHKEDNFVVKKLAW